MSQRPPQRTAPRTSTIAAWSIRLFAALREAAGVPEEAPAAPLQTIPDELGERFGDRFVAVLGYSSVLVDGERWRDPVAPVPDGAELALPPLLRGA